MCRLWATTCQDVSSLGRGALCVCVFVWASVLYTSPSCQDVSSLGNNLSRCIVFRQGGSVCVCINFVWASVLYVSPSCQDVSSLGNNLSRCIVFRQGGSVCVCVCLGICSVHEP